MLKGLQNLNEWLGQLIDLAKMLVVIGTVSYTHLTLPTT